MTATIRFGLDHRPTDNTSLLSWFREVAELTTPDRVVWVDGSDEEWKRMTTALVEAGTFTRLAKKPNSFWAASDPDDVARVEERTYICSADESGAGPTSTGSAAATMAGSCGQGFGENSRVLKWCIERMEGTAAATVADIDAALAVDVEEWKAEIPLIEEWFDKIGDDLPTSTRDQLEALTLRLGM